jgi:predicted Zn-dependent peptidase
MDAAARILDSQIRRRVVEELKIAVAAEVRYVPVPPAHLRISMTGPRMLQSAELALSEIRKMKEYGVRESALDSAKKWMLSEQQMALESSSNWSQQAALAILTGGWGSFGNPEERLQALTTGHLQYVMEKYATGISWGFVGDTTRIDRKTLLRL